MIAKKMVNNVLHLCIVALCLFVNVSLAGSLEGSASGTNLTNPSKLPFLLSSQVQHPPCFSDVLTWHRGVVGNDIYVNDYSIGAASNPLQMVGGPCLTLNGVDEYAQAKSRIPTQDHITVSYEFYQLTTNEAIVIGQFYTDWEVRHEAGGAGIKVFIGDGSAFSTLSFNTPSLVGLHSVEITIDKDLGAGSLVLDGAAPIVATPVTPRSGTNTKKFEVGRRSGGAGYFEGSIWNIWVDDIHFPCIGKTPTNNPASTFATNGLGLDIVSSDYLSVWSGFANNTFFYEATNGYGIPQEYVLYNKDYAAGGWTLYGTITQEGGYQRLTQSVPDSWLMYATGVPIKTNEYFSAKAVVRPVNGYDNELQLLTWDSGFGNANAFTDELPTDSFSTLIFRAYATYTDLIIGLKHVNVTNAIPVDIMSMSVVTSSGISVYAIGDSISTFSAEPTYNSEANCYACLFAVEKKFELFNNSAGGLTLSDIHTRVTADIATYTRFPIALFEGGINDIFAAGTDPNTAMRSETSDILDELVPASDTVVALSIPTGGLSDTKRPWAESYNTWLSAECSFRGIQFFNMDSVLLDPEGVQIAEYYTADTTHQNILGSRAIASALDAFVVVPNTVAEWNHRDDVETRGTAFDGLTRVPTPADYPGDKWNNSMNGFKFIDPVDSSIITADTENMFVNTDGEALTFYQRTLEELGAELQTNNHFTTDLSGYTTTTNWAWEAPGTARHTVGSTSPLTSATTLVDATEYEVTFTVNDSTAGTVTPGAGTGGTGTARSNGTYSERLTCSGSTDFLLSPTTDFDGWVDNVSVRAVAPLVNNNYKYFFDSASNVGLTCYSGEQIGTCRDNALIYSKQGTWKKDDYTGEYIIDDYTLERIYVPF